MAKTKLRKGTKERIYQYWLNHPRSSYAKIGRIFGRITRQRVGQIILEYRARGDRTSEILPEGD